LALAFVILLGIWGFEKVYHLLYGEENPTFFGALPVKYMFDGGEFVILLVVGAFGAYEAYKQLK